MNKKIIFTMMIGAMVLSAADFRYNFNYCIQGDVKGTFLLIFPYRVFFKVSGSVDFIGRETGSDQYCFYFQKAADPACLMRSVGFSGKYFVIITAAGEMDSALVYMAEQIHDFKKNHPYYAKTGKEFRKLIVSIPPDQQDSIQFVRNANGVIEKHKFELVLKPTYDQETIDIFFNPYRIMLEFLLAYNHSFMPVSQSGKLDFIGHWQSPPLDFSRHLNGVAWQVAKIIRKYVTFKQKNSFRLFYRFNRLDDSGIEIIGESHPMVKIWKRFKITYFCRKIKLKPVDHTLIEDSIHLEIRDKNGMGGFAQASLKLID